MSRKITLNFNGALRRFGIRDESMLRLFNNAQSLELTAIKPIINSKRVPIYFNAGTIDISHVIDIVNYDFKLFINKISKFAFDHSANHGCQVVYIEYNKLVITFTKLNLETFIDDFLNDLCVNNIPVGHRSMDGRCMAKVIQVNECINAYGVSHNMIFAEKLNKVYIQFNDLCKSMLTKYHKDITRPVINFLINYAHGNDRGIHFTMYDNPYGEAFDFNFKRLLKHLIDMKSTSDCKGVKGQIELRNSISINNERLSIKLSPGSSIIDFVCELESLFNRDLIENKIVIDCTKTHIKSELRSIINSNILAIDSISLVEWHGDTCTDIASSIDITWENGKCDGTTLRMRCQKIIDECTDDYYMNVLCGLFNGK